MVGKHDFAQKVSKLWMKYWLYIQRDYSIIFQEYQSLVNLEQFRTECIEESNDAFLYVMELYV